MAHKSVEGTLVKWTDQGFGFVITTAGEKIFAHVSEFMDLKTVGPPEIGQRLRFSITGDKGNKRMVRAIRIRSVNIDDLEPL